MSEVPQETLVERTLSNLTTAWRDIAQSAARTVGIAKAPVTTKPESLTRLMRDCLEARGGEVSARMRAAALGRTYLEMDTKGREGFLTVLAHEFSVPAEAVEDAVEVYQAAESDGDRLRAERLLRHALQPPRLRLLTQFNALPEGVKFLVDLRADLLALRSQDPYLQGLDNDLRELLLSWFDTGFLDLRAIDWDSPASLLEKLVAYEAVHEITSWEDLRNRLDSDRRCYALFHPRMPEEPLAFVEVALVQGMAGSIQTLLDEDAPPMDPGKRTRRSSFDLQHPEGTEADLLRRLPDQAGCADPVARVPPDQDLLHAVADSRVPEVAGAAGGRRLCRDFHLGRPGRSPGDHPGAWPQADG